MKKLLILSLLFFAGCVQCKCPCHDKGAVIIHLEPGTPQPNMDWFYKQPYEYRTFPGADGLVLPCYSEEFVSAACISTNWLDGRVANWDPEESFIVTNRIEGSLRLK